MLVTVAIPVRDGGDRLREVLEAVRAQVLPEGVELELVVCDSGSRDGSVETVRSAGGEVVAIAPAEFSHGGTRNLLVGDSRGELVIFLTQDSVPIGVDWLACLIEPFSSIDDLGLAFGPYMPRPEASPVVARELSAWFEWLSPRGEVRIDRLSDLERSIPARELWGPRAYFTDANGCVSRRAWEQVPFRTVGYAEDHALALDMLRAGFAKAFVPGAAVEHSHEYSLLGWLRRSFDEARAVRELYGYVEPIGLRVTALKLRGLVGADWRWSRREGRRLSPGALAGSLAHHAFRLAGTALGGRADRLPPVVVERLSLESRR